MLACSPRATLPIVILAGLGLHRPTDARGQEPVEASPSQPPEVDEPPPELVPFRRDAIGQHLQAGVTANLLLPFGSVSEGVPISSRSGFGGGGTVDLTYGLDRFVSLGVYGEMAWLGSSPRCGSSCSASSLGAGGMVRYHVGQGLRLDPWVSYGFGLFMYGADSETEAFHYAGLELMRFQLGANWYASRHLLLGPVFGLSAAHFIDRPAGESSGGPVIRGTFGIRIAFDVPGRP